MIVAVIGSRGINIADIDAYIPQNCEELVSGGARGVDRAVREYARAKGIPLTEFLPDFARYRKGAPLLRNKQIVDYAEIVVALWDGASPGTKFVIDYCKAVGKPCLLHLIRH